MFQRYQCQLCPQKYKDAAEFLDHFEIHMNQKGKIQNEIENLKNKSLESKSNNEEQTSIKKIKLEDKGILSPIPGKDSNGKKLRSEKNIENPVCKKCEKTCHKKQKLYYCSLCKKITYVQFMIKLRTFSVNFVAILLHKDHI